MSALKKGTLQLALLAVCIFAFCRNASIAQDLSSQRIEILWRKSTLVAIPGVTDVVILDDAISRAQVSSDKVEFFGLSRGETVALVWVGGERVSLRLNVVAPVIKVPMLKPSDNELAALGTGTIGSSMQTSLNPNGTAGWFQLHHLEWQQQNDGKRIAVRGQVQNGNVVGAPRFNLNSASIAYETPRVKLSLVDFLVEMHASAEAKISPYSSYNVQMLRGASAQFLRGTYQVEVFGGSTIPSHYLSLRGTRDAAGLSIKHRPSDRLFTYATTGWVSSPVVGANSSMQRQNGLFQTAGFAYKSNAPWAIAHCSNHMPTGSPTRPGRVLAMMTCSFGLVPFVT